MLASIRKERDEVGSKFLGTVFFYLFIALAITALVAGLTGYVFTNLFPITYGEFVVENATSYLKLLIGSAVAYFILIIWINFFAFRGKGPLVLPFILYTVVVGILLSSMTMFVPIELIGVSLGITCLAFGLMFLIGYFSKRDLGFLPLVIFGLLLGSLLIALFNFIWQLFFPNFQVYYWLVSYGMFFMVILITIYDMYRIRKIQQSGAYSNNVAFYCAFNLYVDFIYIFVRILTLVIRIYSKSRN